MTKRLTAAILALSLTFAAFAAFLWLGRQMQASARQQELNFRLISAVRFNDVPAVARLLDAGANPNTREENRLTFIQRLLMTLREPRQGRARRSSDFRFPSSGPNALWLAYVSRHNDIAALLLKHGANPNTAFLGVPPLLDIVAQGDTALLQIFLDGGANVNICDAQKGMTALMSAASRGRTRDVKLLLARGANVHLKNKAGKTALMLARENKRADVVQLFTAGGARQTLDFAPKARLGR